MKSSRNISAPEICLSAFGLFTAKDATNQLKYDAGILLDAVIEKEWSDAISMAKHNPLLMFLYVDYDDEHGKPANASPLQRAVTAKDTLLISQFRTIAKASGYLAYFQQQVETVTKENGASLSPVQKC